MPRPHPMIERLANVIRGFIPQLSAASLNPDAYGANDIARCLTDEEIVALPPTKPYPFLK